MRTLRLTEHQLQKEVELSRAAAAALSALGRGITITPSWSRDGHYDLRPGAHVGVIALPDVQVIIEPKLPIDRVLFLISYTLDPARWQRDDGLYGTTDTIVEAIAAIFAHSLRNALRQGVLQGYRTKQDALTTVRGRILLDEQLRRRFGAPLPIELAFDEFTVDNDLNRVFKATLHKLSRLPIRSAGVRRGLAARAAALESVALVEYASNAPPTFTWNRLNRHFEPAADLARMILEGTSLELGETQNRGAAFTIDMNLVFEHFVRTALREALRLDRHAFPDRPPPLALDAAQKIRLVPDLTWWDGEQCLFVGDVKYKRIAPDGFLHADLYQLLAYAVALGLRDGLLVYPAGEGFDGVHVVERAGVRLHVRAIDVTGTPLQILSGVEALAAQIRVLARSDRERHRQHPGPQKIRAGFEGRPGDELPPHVKGLQVSCLGTSWSSLTEARVDTAATNGWRHRLNWGLTMMRHHALCAHVYDAAMKPQAPGDAALSLATDWHAIRRRAVCREGSGWRAGFRTPCRPTGSFGHDTNE